MRGPAPLPIETAKRDGALLRLLVDYSDGDASAHPIGDVADLAWTIGHNNFDNDGEDRWQFAGWCWSHDHYTEGRGRVVGWLPFHTPAAEEVAQELVGEVHRLKSVIADLDAAAASTRAEVFLACGDAARTIADDLRLVLAAIEALS